MRQVPLQPGAMNHIATTPVMYGTCEVKPLASETPASNPTSDILKDIGTLAISATKKIAIATASTIT